MKTRTKLLALGALLIGGIALAQTYSQFSYLRVLNILDVRTSIQNQDAAESVVIKAIRNEDTEVAKWYLVKKHRDRGYGDQVEQKHTGEIVLIKLDQ